MPKTLAAEIDPYKPVKQKNGAAVRLYKEEDKWSKDLYYLNGEYWSDEGCWLKRAWTQDGVADTFLLYESEYDLVNVSEYASGTESDSLVPSYIRKKI